MSEDPRTIRDALNDAIKKRDQLKEDKTNKINRLASQYDTRIRKLDLYIEMLSGEPGVKEEKIQPDMRPRRRSPAPSLPVITSVSVAGQEATSGKPTRAQIIMKLLEEAGMPLRIMDILERLEKSGHKVEGSQPYGTVQSVMLRNKDVFCKTPDRSWGLVEWADSGQDNKGNEEEIDAG